MPWHERSGDELSTRELPSALLHEQRNLRRRDEPQPLPLSSAAVTICRYDWSAAIVGDPIVVERDDLLAPPFQPCACDPTCEPSSSFVVEHVEDDLYRIHGPDTELIGTVDPVVEAAHRAIEDTFAKSVRTRTLIHAGVVRQGDRAIVLPGASFSGKTTLVLALVEAGATYFSDEFAVIDDDGMVEPFRRNPRPRGEAPTAVSGLERVDIRDDRAPVGLVASLHYRAGSSAALDRVSEGRGVLELASNAVSVRERPDAVLAAIRRAVTGAEVVVGDRGEAAETAAVLLDWLTASRANAGSS